MVVKSLKKLAKVLPKPHFLFFLWDIENRRCHRTIQDAQEHFVSSIDVTPKGHKVVSGSVDTKIAVWNCR